MARLGEAVKCTLSERSFTGLLVYKNAINKICKILVFDGSELDFEVVHEKFIETLPNNDIELDKFFREHNDYVVGSILCRRGGC